MGARFQPGLGGAKVTADGALSVADDTLRPGENQLTDRVDVFDGDAGVAFGTTAGLALRAAPCAFIRVRCLTGGTITTMHDNASAASGTLVVAAITMVAGQVLEIGEYMANGLYVVASSGTYRATCPLLAS